MMSSLHGGPLTYTHIRAGVTPPPLQQYTKKIHSTPILTFDKVAGVYYTFLIEVVAECYSTDEG